MLVLGAVSETYNLFSQIKIGHILEEELLAVPKIRQLIIDLEEFLNNYNDHLTQIEKIGLRNISNSYKSIVSLLEQSKNTKNSKSLQKDIEHLFGFLQTQIQSLMLLIKLRFNNSYEFYTKSGILTIGERLIDIPTEFLREYMELRIGIIISNTTSLRSQSILNSPSKE